MKRVFSRTVIILSLTDSQLMIPADTSLLRRMPTPRLCLSPPEYTNVTSSEMSLSAPVQHIDTPRVWLDRKRLSDDLCQLTRAKQRSYVSCSYTGVMFGRQDTTHMNPDFLTAFIWTLQTAADAPTTKVVGTVCHNRVYCTRPEDKSVVCSCRFCCNCVCLPERA